mmetsp:Transcript_58454/g.190625  ORF Transcript_58454/g.190625 Transcript_58454/m.190625 type:complete len:259 (-) Transcript_58454:178-954(-)
MHRQPHAHGGAAKIAHDRAAANSSEDLVGKHLGAGSELISHVEGSHLVDLDVVAAAGRKSGVHGAGVHSVDVDATGLALHGQACRQLGDAGLGAAVHDSEGVGDETGGGAGEDDAAFELLRNQLAVKVVCQVDVRCKVAVEVGQVGFDGVLLEEARHDEARVVENKLHIHVVGGLLHVFHPSTARVRQIGLDLPDLLLGELLLELLHGLGEHRLIARDDDHIQALRQQLARELLADSGRPARDKGPLGRVLGLQVLLA